MPFWLPACFLCLHSASFSCADVHFVVHAFPHSLAANLMHAVLLGAPSLRRFVLLSSCPAQGAKANQDPAYYDERIEAFLTNFRTTLSQMGAKEFATLIDTLVSARERPVLTLREAAGRDWLQVTDHTYFWNVQLAEIAALKNLTHQELLDFYTTRVFAPAELPAPESESEEGKARRKTKVELWGKDKTPHAPSGVANEVLARTWSGLSLLNNTRSWQDEGKMWPPRAWTSGYACLPPVDGS